MYLPARFLILVLALIPLLGVPQDKAWAIGLDSAKSQGLVGERPDGLLGIVGASSPELDALVKDVNGRRLDVFKGIAAKNGQSLSTVQSVSGDEFITRTPSGQYVMDAQGHWQKK